jgi:hypothetical protein
MAARLYVAVWPPVTVAENEESDWSPIEKSVPIPLTGTVACVPPELTVTVPIASPAVVGAKVTFTIQEAPGFKITQSLFCEKPALTETALMVPAPLVVFLIVRVWAELVPTI